MRSSKNKRNQKGSDGNIRSYASKNNRDEDSCPPILYKYLGAEFGPSVLEQEMVRYTQPKHLNDPFEVNAFMESIVGYDHMEKYARTYQTNYIQRKLAELQGADNRFARRIVRRTARDTDHLYMSAIRNKTMQDTLLIREQLDIYRDMVCMLCTTEAKDNLLMWSHYADQHKGFVIGIDTKHPCVNRRRSATDEHNYFRPTSYEEKRPKYFMSEATREQILLSKSKNWEYEEEWRVVSTIDQSFFCMKKENEDPMYFFQIPIDAIKEVYLGALMKDKTRTKIIDELRKKQNRHSIKLYNVTVHKKEFELVFEEEEYRT